MDHNLNPTGRLHWVGNLLLARAIEDRCNPMVIDIRAAIDYERTHAFTLNHGVFKSTQAA